MEQLERLLKLVYRPQNVYCIHIDYKSSFEVHPIKIGPKLFFVTFWLFIILCDNDKKFVSGCES